MTGELILSATEAQEQEAQEQNVIFFCIFFGDYLVIDELRLKFADEFLRKDAVAE